MCVEAIVFLDFLTFNARVPGTQMVSLISTDRPIKSKGQYCFGSHERGVVGEEEGVGGVERHGFFSSGRLCKNKYGRQKGRRSQGLTPTPRTIWVQLRDYYWLYWVKVGSRFGPGRVAGSQYCVRAVQYSVSQSRAEFYIQLFLL